MMAEPTSVAPAGYQRVSLDALPSLGALYTQALGRQARGKLTGSPRARALPQVVYEVGGAQVDPEHLTAYQHLLGERASDILPGGFVHVFGFPLAVAVMARADFPLPLLGMVHVSNHVTQRRSLRLGPPLRVRAWAQELRSRRSGTQVQLVVEVEDDASGPAGHDAAEPAWRGVSTYLARGVRIPGLDPAEETDRDDAEHPTPTAVWKLAAGTGREYAKVSGDINPIHTSSLGAKALGFPRAIAHGMYTASRALAEVGPRRGEAYTWTVNFAAPVLLPGTVCLAIDHDDHGGFTYRGWGKKLNFTGTVEPA